MPTSTVPAVWLALHAAVDAATATPVHLGPPVTDDGNMVCIGYADGGDAVTNDIEWAALGAQSQEERYGIACLIWTASGDTDMSSRITDAYALLDVVAGVLDADYTIGGNCRIALIGDQAALPEQDANGSALRLRFTVGVAARIT